MHRYQVAKYVIFDSRFYSNVATCKPTLFLFAVKEILRVHFIITNFWLPTKCCVHRGCEIL
jgi:hypothetical protein